MRNSYRGLSGLLIRLGDGLAGRRSVRDLLTDLGTTPEAVAEKMQALGICGVRCSEVACPIARYLQSGGHRFLRVRGAYAVGSRFVPFACPIPYPVRTFITRFDRGVYDALCYSRGGRS